MKQLLLPLAGLALCLSGLGTARANDISLFRTIYNTDCACCGAGGLRDIGTGVITLSGVTGKVTRAYLYWNGPVNSLNPTANASVLVNNQPVVGVNIGFSSANCWFEYLPPQGMNISQAYRADVTSLVAARRNGTYALSGFSKPMHTRTAPININGASLIVFFDDGNPLNNRDVVLFEGNDSNAANSYDAPGWNVALKGIKYSAGKALLQMHVSDGQLFAPPHDDDSLMLNGQVLAPGPNVFCGNSVPSSNMGPTGNGCLWDIKTFDISSFLHRGTNAFSLSFGSLDGDCVSLIVAAINLPAGAAPPPTNTPPTITCPRPIITESLDAVVLQAQVRDIDGNALGYTISIDGTELESGSIPASARPTLGVISFTNTFSLGEHVVNFTVSDGRATETCATMVTVADHTPPTIHCPPNISTTNDLGACAALLKYSVAASDNMPGMTLVCVPASGSAFPIGTTTVNCCATDGSSNATVCTFTVTVRDAELPRLIVPADIVTPNDAGKCGAVVSFKVTATDNCCGSPAVLCSPASGCLFPKGVTTVKCAATDPSGNTASCAFTVTVLDKEPPVVECKPARSPDCKNTPASRADDDEKSFGILQLFTRDNCDPNPKIFVKDSATGLISGPYQSGDKVKLTHSRRDKPNQNKPAPAGIPQIQIRGDALIYAVDASGNISQTLRCKHGGFCRDRDQDEDRDDCKPDSDREHHQD